MEMEKIYRHQQPPVHFLHFNIHFIQFDHDPVRRNHTQL